MGASATSGVKFGMFKGGPSESERGLALMDCRTQTGQCRRSASERIGGTTVICYSVSVVLLRGEGCQQLSKFLYMTVVSMRPSSVTGGGPWRQRHHSQPWPEEVVEVVVPSVHPERGREAPRQSTHRRARKLPWLCITTTTIRRNQACHRGSATLAD